MHTLDVASPIIMPRIVKAVVLDPKAKVDKLEVLQEPIGSMLSMTVKRWKRLRT